MTLKEEILALLDSEWDAGVVTKPKRLDKEIGEPMKSGVSLFVDDQVVEHALTGVGAGADVEITPALITGYATTKERAELLYSEVARIIRAKSGNGEIWRVANHFFMEEQKITTLSIEVERVQFVAF